MPPQNASMQSQVDGTQDVASNITVVVPCINYDDFLRLTLPVNQRKLPNITVLTAPDDSATIRVADSLAVPVFTTSSWYSEGPLNKGLALNEWLDATKDKDHGWLLTLDADILLPTSWSLDLGILDKRGLYSNRRRMCEDYLSFKSYRNGCLSLEHFPINVPPVIEGKVWGHRPTSNPAGLSGYFQLWNPEHAVGHRRFTASGTAAKYDVEFGLSFPEHLRRYVGTCDVLHLGTSRVNWSGRQSARWDLTTVDQQPTVLPSKGDETIHS